MRQGLTWKWLYRWGSVVTPWQTSVSSVTVMPLTSLYASQLGSLLFCKSGQGMLNTEWLSTTAYSEMASSGVANCIWEKDCLWKQPCAEQSHAHQWGASAVSQVEASISRESSMEHWRGVGRLRWMLLASSFKLLNLYTLFAGFSSWHSPELSGSHLTGDLSWWFRQWVGHWYAVR